MLGTIVAIVLLLIVVALLATNIRIVPQAQAFVVERLGAYKGTWQVGLHFKIPFIQHARSVDATVKGIKIGYGEDGSGNTYSIEHESIMITSDYNFIDCDFYVSYQVTDPIKYLYNSDQPDLIVKNIAMSCIRSTVSAFNVDNAITTGKSEIQRNVKSMIVAELEQEDIGITLIDASIQDVEPPTDLVITAFTAVETAKQGKESAINEANAYRNEQIPAAEASADKIEEETGVRPAITVISKKTMNYLKQNVKIKVMMEPYTSPTDASASANAVMKSTPSKNPPV